MSLTSEFERIEALRNEIRDVLSSIYLVDDTATLEACAEALKNMNIYPNAFHRTITSSTEIYRIPAGYHSGGESVGINPNSVANLKAENIKSGVSIMEVTGTMADVASGTADATATAGHILNGKTAYVDGKKITGTIPTVEQATPSISVDANGLITASSTQSAGYVAAGTKTATHQLPTRGERVITPGANPIVILKGHYLTGDQTIAGSVNLIPENIKQGVTIFGVTGTYSPDTGGNMELIYTSSTASTVGTASPTISGGYNYDLLLIVGKSDKDNTGFNTITLTKDAISKIASSGFVLADESTFTRYTMSINSSTGDITCTRAAGDGSIFYVYGINF